MTTIRIKRAYDAASDSDGFRILVDRVWPRGISKENAKIGVWLKEIAPSSDLRKWFGHDPEKWGEFKRRYFSELAANRKAVEVLRQHLAENDTLTLVYSARDETHNNAVALKAYLDGRG